jgi:putative transposase
MGDGAAAKTECYRVHRGEPGQNIVTELKDGEPMIENLPVALVPGPSLPPLPSHQNEISYWRFILLNALWEKISKNPGVKKRKIINQILKEYNSGALLPDISKKLKKISRPTLYRWIKAYKEGGIDALVPEYRGPKTSEILPGEKDFLLKFLLNQNKKTISDAIRECKRYLGSFSPSAPTTLRRYVNDFKKNNYDVWTLEREGEKAWNDKVAPYQDRDPMSLYVGEVLVADGHKLNFRVKDPITGKEKRPTLVMFWDWKSAYPVGWEIMMTENIQCITGAL